MKTNEKVLIGVGVLAVIAAGAMYFYTKNTGTTIGSLLTSTSSKTGSSPLSYSTDAHVQTAAERDAMSPAQRASFEAMVASINIPVRYVDPKLTT
jgi:hypothetical protein